VGINNEESVRTSLDKLLKERHMRLMYPQKVGRVAILKSAGLGITTLMLYYIAYICMKDDKLKGDRNCSRVKTNDGRMIDICDDCAKYMKNADELVQVSPPHNGSIDHSYRFVNPKEKKKCRQAV
jgi:hypothetical protein